MKDGMLFLIIGHFTFLGELLELPHRLFGIHAQFGDVRPDEPLDEHARRQQIVAILFQEIEIRHRYLRVLGYLVERDSSFFTEALEVFSKAFHRRVNILAGLQSTATFGIRRSTRGQDRRSGKPGWRPYASSRGETRLPAAVKDSIITPSPDVQELNAETRAGALGRRARVFIERYPAVFAVVFLASGIVCGAVFDTKTTWFGALGLLAGSLLVTAVLRDRGNSALLFCAAAALIFAVGMLTSRAEIMRTELQHVPASKTRVEATVKRIRSSGPDFRVLIVSDGVLPAYGIRLPASGRVFLRDNSISLGHGDRIAFRSYLRTPENRGNPGEFDWETHCRSEGIAWLASVRGEDSLLLLRRGAPYAPVALIFGLRERMKSFLDRHVSGETRAVMKGIALGDRGEMTPGLRRVFADSGLAHLLSASGLHTAVVAAVCGVLTALAVRARPTLALKIPFPKAVVVVAAPAMIAYCALVGARVPSIRATIMGLVFATAVVMNKRWRSVNTLAVAGLIILLIDPQALFSLGFRLSFAAVFGIMMIAPPVIRRMRIERPAPAERRAHSDGRRSTGPLDAALSLARSLSWKTALRASAFVAVTVAAQVSVAPFILHTFHAHPLFGLPANLIAAPLLFIALPLTLIGMIVGLLFPSLGALLLRPAELCVRLIIDTAVYFGGEAGDVAFFPYAGTFEFLCAIGTLALLFLVLHRFSYPRLAGTVFAAVFTALLLVHPVRSVDAATAVVTFLNVGKADAALIELPDGTNVLVDAGARTQYFDAGERIVVPYLRRRGVTSLREIIVSHPQADHIGGAPAVMRWARTPVVRMNPIGFTTSLLDEVREALAEKAGSAARGDRTIAPVTIGRARFTFVNLPGPSPLDRSDGRAVNNASLVCRVDYGSVSFLFTGDIHTEAENELVSSGLPLRATVLKVPHHGCRGSSSLPFLRAVRPKVAVVSSSEYPFASCPDFGVVQRLTSVGAEVFRTARDGAVIVSTDGRNVQVTTGKSGRTRGFSSTR